MLKSFFDGLEEIRQYRWLRITIQVFLMFLSTGIAAKVALHDPESGALGMILWASFILLYRVFFYDRLAAYPALVAGLLWLPLGEPLMVFFWMGIQGILVHFYRSRRSFSPILVWYIVLTVAAVSGYTELYSLSAHPVYLALFLFLLVGWFPCQSMIKNAREKWAEQKRVLSVEAEKEERRHLTAGEQCDTIIRKLQSLNGLPAPLFLELQKIIMSAKNIRECMRNDPRDEPAGRQFLERYLPVVYTIVSKGQKLARQTAKSGGDSETEEAQLATLQQVSDAFNQMHRQLLENDTDDLNVEVSLMDSLLKADGFKK